MHIPKPPRQWVVAGTSLLVLVTALGTSYYFETSANRAYLVERNFRVLAAPSRQPAELVALLFKMLETDAGASEKLEDCAKTRNELVDWARFTYGRLSKEEETAPKRAVEWSGEGRLKLTLNVPASCLTMKVEADLENVLRRSLIGGVFDAVLITDGESKVLVSLGSEDLVLRTVPPPPARKGEPEEKLIPDAPRLFEAKIADRRFFVFQRPLAPVAPQAEKQAPATINGFVSLARFRAESLALNPHWLAALAIVVLAGVFGWPLLKIGSIGAKERIRLRDLAWLALSFLLCTALAVLALLELEGYLRSRLDSKSIRPDVSIENVDVQLKSLAVQITDSLDREIADALRFLDQVTTWHEFKDGEIGTDFARTDAPRSYPFFDFVFWMDETGRQRVKWTTHPQSSPFSRFDERDYFKRVRDGRLWKKGAHKYFMESVRSRGTGEIVSMLSTPAHRLRVVNGTREVCTDRWVTALTMNSRSLFDVVLPSGFGFAVLSENGQTLFHSNPDRALQENFPAESDKEAALRSLLFAPAKDCLTTKYWGRDHRVFVRRMNDAEEPPWRLAVFYDLERLRTLHIDVMILSTSLFTSLTLVLLACAVAVHFVLPGGAARPLWPSCGASARYATAGFVFLILSAAFSRVAFSESTGAPLAACFLIPLGGMGLGAVILTERVSLARRLKTLALLAIPPFGLLVALVPILNGESQNVTFLLAALGVSCAVAAFSGSPRRSLLSEPRWARRTFIATGLSSLLLFGVLPMLSFYRISWLQHAELFVGHNELDLANRLAERDGRTRADESRCPSGKEASWYRPAFTGDLYEVASLNEESPGIAGEPAATVLPAWFLTWVFDTLPHPNETGVQIHHLGPLGEDTRFRTEGGKLAFEPPGERPRYRVTSAVPSFEMHRGREFLVGLVIWLALAGWVLRWLVKRLFFLDFEQPEVVPVTELVTKDIRAHSFLVCAPHVRRSVFLERRDVYTVDLREMSARPAVARVVDFSLLAPDSILCFDHFALDPNPEKRSAALELIESALRERSRPVVILSETKPPELEAASAAGDVENGQAQRWAGALGSFVCLYVDDAGAPGDFERMLRSAEARALTRVTGPDEVEASPRGARIRMLFRVVSRECVVHRQLQVLGEEVIRLNGFLEFSRERVIRRIREMAEPYYQLLWLSLSSDEKLLLVQIARGFLPNPKSAKTLSRLMARRLIEHDGGFRLMNQSFSRFVVSAMEVGELSALERTGVESVWRQIRIPVLMALVVSAGFLSWTQGDAFRSILGMLTAASTALPLFLKLVDMVKLFARADERALHG